MIKFTVLLAGLFLVQSSSKAETRIVYGKDSRIDIKNIFNPKIKELSKSIAGRVYNLGYNPTEGKEGYITFDNILPLSHPRSMNLCKDQKFADQPSVADCTGFLISNKYLVTAGHCAVRPGETITDSETYACSAHSWAFDYMTNSSKETLNLKEFKASNVYGCKRVVYGTWQPEDDYAIIELDREVLDREPLKLNLKNNIKSGNSLFIMGHPSGLPMKYADGAKVFEVKKDYFTTNLDSFGGNSGSPVFNKLTLEVEGILVRGDIDYVEQVQDDGSICLKVNTCNNERKNCTEDDPEIFGEHVSLISKVLKFIK